MICLGIESTAHTFGVGIVREREILANVKRSYSPEKTGIIPREAAEHHVQNFDGILGEAVRKAGISLRDIDLIAFSQGPGLGHCLRIGAAAARSLAWLMKKPLIGVNHCIAHLEIGKLVTDATEPVLLYVSGGNTQVIAFESGRYRIFGETLDIGLGNLLDTFARHIGLGFPGGPEIYKLSLKSKNYIELPYTVKGMDVSFGGLLTNLKNKWDTGKYTKEDLAYSLQETVFAMCVEVCERAMAHCNKNELLLGGGVACNLRLQEMAAQMCQDRNAKMFVPPAEFLVDNGAMIAWLGMVMYRAGSCTQIEKSNILPNQRTDDVEVSW